MRPRVFAYLFLALFLASMAHSSSSINICELNKCTDIEHLSCG